MRDEPQRFYGRPHDRTLNWVHALALPKHSWDFVSVHCKSAIFCTPTYPGP
jgi:hypothetical protein